MNGITSKSMHLLQPPSKVSHNHRDTVNHSIRPKVYPATTTYFREKQPN